MGYGFWELPALRLGSVCGNKGIEFQWCDRLTIIVFTGLTRGCVFNLIIIIIIIIKREYSTWARIRVIGKRGPQDEKLTRSLY